MDGRKVLEDLLAQSVTFETSEQMAEALVKDCELFTDALCHIIQEWMPRLNPDEFKLTPSQLDRVAAAAMRLKAVGELVNSFDRIRRRG